MCQICNYNENIATLPCDRCSKRLGPNGWHHASGGFRFHDDCKSASGEAAPREEEIEKLLEDAKLADIGLWRADVRGGLGYETHDALGEARSVFERLILALRTLSDGRAAAEARAKEAGEALERERKQVVCHEHYCNGQHFCPGCVSDKDARISELSHELEEALDERSEYEEQIAEMVYQAGLTCEWSNCHDHKDCVGEAFAVLEAKATASESRCAAMERALRDVMNRAGCHCGLVDPDCSNCNDWRAARAALSAEPAKPEMPECVRRLLEAVTYEAGDHYDCFNIACKFMRPFDALPDGRPHNPDCLIAAVESYYAKPFVPAGEEK